MMSAAYSEASLRQPEADSSDVLRRVVFPFSINKNGKMTSEPTVIKTNGRYRPIHWQLRSLLGSQELGYENCLLLKRGQTTLQSEI